MDFFFAIFPIFFIAVFGLVIFTFVKTFSDAAAEKKRNDSSPRLTVEARVVGKRTYVGRHGSTSHSHSHSYTRYFVTFEVESGDRMELSVGGSDFGMLIDGDKGRLSFQGTRYLGFERDTSN